MSKKAKLSIFKTAFVHIVTYGHESLVVTESAIASAGVRNEVFTKNQKSYTSYLRCVALWFENLLKHRAVASPNGNISA